MATPLPNSDPASAPTGWALSVAVAERVGWYLLPCHPADQRPQGIPPGGGGKKLKAWQPIPNYHESLDACFRDLAPMLEKRGWIEWWLQGNFGVGAGCCLGSDEDTVGTGGPAGQTPSEALCRAFLEATKDLP